MHQEYRNLDADRRAGKTARRTINYAQRLDRQEAEEAQKENTVQDGQKNIRGSGDFSIRSKYLREQLKRWAVTPGETSPPLKDIDPRIFQPDELAEAVKTVQDVIYLLPTVAQAHPAKRAALIGILGAALGQALDDTHSRRWYCKTIWQAWKADIEGQGGLQVLAAHLARLNVDRREWGMLRRPAALLAARLRAV